MMTPLGMIRSMGKIVRGGAGLRATVEPRLEPPPAGVYAALATATAMLTTMDSPSMASRSLVRVVGCDLPAGPLTMPDQTSLSPGWMSANTVSR